MRCVRAGFANAWPIRRSFAEACAGAERPGAGVASRCDVADAIVRVEPPGGPVHGPRPWAWPPAPACTPPLAEGVGSRRPGGSVALDTAPPPLAVSTVIDAVTVYREGAVLTRVGSLAAPASAVHVGGLPLCLDDTSLLARLSRSE